MLEALRRHWPEYLMEAAGLGLFMVSALLFSVLLEYPASPLRQALPDGTFRRVLMGLAMGLTAIALVYSPWGKRSGGHFNPALTLAFYRLGKVEPRDALFYVLAQFAGGLAGVLFVQAVLGALVADPSVRFAVTVPGPAGTAVAFVAEVVISFLLMTAVLAASNSPRFERFTGLFAGALVATYISLEAPLSGMSMNPARTFASAMPPRIWTALWVYFLAPALGMILAGELWLLRKRKVACAKLHHRNSTRCIFRCDYGSLGEKPLATAVSA